MFLGETDINQLGRIIRTMGSIDTGDWPEAEELPDWHKISFSACNATLLQELLPNASTASIELLQEMLRWAGRMWRFFYAGQGKGGRGKRLGDQASRATAGDADVGWRKCVGYL